MHLLQGTYCCLKAHDKHKDLRGALRQVSPFYFASVVNWAVLT